MTRAIVCRELGPPSGLIFTDWPSRPLRPGEARVRMAAAGVNFPDYLMVQGLYQYKPPLPFVPGFEGAGVVTEVADDVTAVAIGDAVILRLRAGTFAEEAIAPASDLWPLPPGWSMAEGAAMPTVAVTADVALVARGQAQAGEVLLVLGAGGGVGLAAVELGALLGLDVVAVASTPEKRRAALDRGATEAVAAIPSGLKADLVFDPVAGDQFTPALETLVPGGRYLVIGFAGGAPGRPETALVQRREVAILGVRAGEYGRRDPAAGQASRDRVLAWARAGRLKPLIGGCYPLAAAAQALEALGDRRAMGKLVLEP
ncbi:MAG: NADPH:quinone oxidoreductase family protein [Alphaproteobacteria bacterium]|jgi:NADPH2:quinone reductase|nr:NADPH:quinone oxidoreductase family protein [Alphaproteobacteria bacterium]